MMEKPDVVPIDRETNPVRVALEEVNNRIKEHKNRLRKAEDEIKFLTADLEKQEKIASKLAEALRISEQPSEQRYVIAQQVKIEEPPPEEQRQRVPYGYWKKTILEVLSDGPLTRGVLRAKLTAIAPSFVTMTVIGHAIDHQISEGHLIQEGEEIYSREWIEKK